jgi:hypothetical protein
MEINDLTVIVSLILALSIASERLLEIVKGFIGKLAEKGKTEKQERHRRSALQLLAVVSGIVTTFLAAPVLPENIVPSVTGNGRWLSLVALGLLASGGSGLWNGILTYVLKVKDLKGVDLKKGEASIDALHTKIKELQDDLDAFKALNAKAGIGKI